MENALLLLIDIWTANNLSNETPRILFLNGQEHDAFASENINICQPFKANTSQEIYELATELYDLVMIIGPKQVQEAQYLIATGLEHLKDGGSLLVSADNKENGKRLNGWLESMSLEGESYSGHKAKAVLVTKPAKFISPLLQEWKNNGAVQKNNDGFVTQPGLFSWNRIDPASELLIQTIDDDLKGNIADFGCGYGYLSLQALKQHQNVKHIDGYDADARALFCYQKNLEAMDSYNFKTHWADLGKEYKAPLPYDVVIMNPPFHEGRKDLPALGISFIQNAAQNLKKNGVLWVVANKHLPYEKTLEDAFFKIEKKAEKNGFKVYRCVK